MKVVIMKEVGYEQAMEGIRLSYNTTIERATEASKKLYSKDGGHNKFLEFIDVYLDVTAARYWWSEADTYRVGVSKQSESTMHTLLKNPLTQDNFQYPIPAFYLEYLNLLLTDKKLLLLKNALPEGYLQRRIWKVSYANLRNIVKQRHDHKLIEWKLFCGHILSNIEHKEYFVDLQTL